MVGRHAAMSVSSASAVTITLLIISIFMIVTGNMQEVTHNIEGSVKISAFVAYDHEEQAQLDMIQATIKNLNMWSAWNTQARIRNSSDGNV